MVEKGDFIWLIGVRFHASDLFIDDEMLIFIRGLGPG